MNNPFRRPLTVYRKSTGSWDGPVYVPGPEVLVPDIKANVQPLSARDLEQTRVHAGGRSLDGAVKIYTDARLYTVNTPNQQPDVIIHHGERYIVIGEGAYDATQSHVSHNKYVAVLEIPHAEASA